MYKTAQKKIRKGTYQNDSSGFLWVGDWGWGEGNQVDDQVLMYYSNFYHKNVFLY